MWQVSAPSCVQRCRTAPPATSKDSEASSIATVRICLRAVPALDRFARLLCDRLHAHAELSSPPSPRRGAGAPGSSVDRVAGHARRGGGPVPVRVDKYCGPERSPWRASAYRIPSSISGHFLGGRATWPPPHRPLRPHAGIDFGLCPKDTQVGAGARLGPTHGRAQRCGNQ
jgi:hypothetical protein